nr:uncharacterized protein LOC128685954 [Cherax quadricarinatus]
MPYSPYSVNQSHYWRDDAGEPWLTARVLENANDAENNTLTHSVVRPDWSLVQGTFTHLKDENFEEFLITSGVPYIVRSIIVKAVPTVTIEYFYQNDDYYYDLENHYIDTDLDKLGVGDGRVYQVVITTDTWIKSNEERFRPGYAFVKQDYDGTPSKNTYWFVSPSVLMHQKQKEKVTINIIRSFHADGFIMTIINNKTGMRARRHFLREA